MSVIDFDSFIHLMNDSFVSLFLRFRRLEQFTNLDILSDYRLLEEITREKESKKRNSPFRFRPSRKMKLKENVRYWTKSYARFP